MSILLAVNSTLLFVATALVAFQLIKGGHGSMAGLKAGLKELSIKRYRTGLKKRMSFFEKVELQLIDKSNIRRYIPFADLYTLIALTALIFLVCLAPLYRLLLFFPPALIISALFALIPVFALDLMGRYNSESIRRKLAYFISVLNRWCAVKEDIFYAFEKSVDSGIGEPLKTFIRDMVIQVNRGIKPLDALDMLQAKVDNPQFRDFILNVKQNVKYRGDIGKLLSNLEGQFYKIEEEYNRRKISTYKDRLLIYIVMFLVLACAYYFLKTSSDAAEFYLGTQQGKLFLTVFCILYALGSYVAFGVSRFKH